MRFRIQEERRSESIRIGIPRALLYFKQAAFWTVFFEKLGARVVLSPPTDRVILEEGIRLSVDESCLPAKIFLGHVAALIGKVDRIFIPRQESLVAGEALCTRLWGLPDIARNSFESVDWLELNVSPTLDDETFEKAWWRVGKELTNDRRAIRRAMRLASEAQERYESFLLVGFGPEEALRRARSTEGADRFRLPTPLLPGERHTKIAVLGHAYVVWDRMFGIPVLKMLEELGAETLTLERVPGDTLQDLGREVSPTLRWTYSREVVGGMEHFLREGIDGLVLLETFPCGPDALVLDLATRKLKGRAPIVRIVLDELQSMSGMRTRLESFVDVLTMRKEETRV